MHFKFIHEGAHQKNSAAGGLQEVFVSQRVRHLMQIETLPLIDDVNHELIAGHLELELNLLVPLLFISVADGIDHALAHGHADLQAVVIVEARSSGHALDTYKQGIYRLRLGTNDMVFCVDLLDSAESNIKPRDELQSRRMVEDVFEFSGPIRSVQGAVLNRFAEVPWRDLFG